MHEAFALLKSGRLGKRPFRLKDLPNYILMELWMIWNMVPYLWYRLGTGGRKHSQPGGIIQNKNTGYKADASYPVFFI